MNTPPTETDTRALDREIAERLGWRPEKLETGWRWRKGDMKWTAPERLYGTAEGVFDWLYDNEVIPHYSGDLDAAWRLQQEHPIPGTICLNLSWLQLPPEQVAREMAQAWLKWSTAAAPAADGEEGKG